MEQGTKFTITSTGYTNSKRQPQDGYIYIGVGDKRNLTESAIIDIVFPKEERGMGEQQLVIRYFTQDEKYKIKDLGQGTGTYAKIVKPIKLKEGYIISFCETSMAIEALTPEKLIVQFIDGEKADQKM